MNCDHIFQKHKNELNEYINNIKKNMKINFFNIVNPTLVKNPYDSKLVYNFFLEQNIEKKSYLRFFQRTFLFYCKQFYLLTIYFITFVLFKIFNKKNDSIENIPILIDVFLLVDQTIANDKFEETFFPALYEVMDKEDLRYAFLPRFHSFNRNPFKIIPILKILFKDPRKFLFEFELLKIRDFLRLTVLILAYPFKTLQLLQKDNTVKDDIFNADLIEDIPNIGFEAFSRYILGVNISKISSVHRIYSWSEFQVIERSFNYGLRSHNNMIELYGCQLLLYGESYCNVVIDEIDALHKSAYHKVLVNGHHYMQERENIEYIIGPSLRYKDVFLYQHEFKSRSNIVVLGSYDLKETKFMLSCVSNINEVIFKKHPLVSLDSLGDIQDNITIFDCKSIYDIFPKTNIVLATASGVLVEAVACGISVIVMGSRDGITENSLVEYGKGEIWDIAYNQNDIQNKYNKLLSFREHNIEMIKKIAEWYKQEFFLEPTEKNIIERFNLRKG